MAFQNLCKFSLSIANSENCKNSNFSSPSTLRFLVFNKRTKQFMTTKPLEVFPSMFVTHQLNAFDAADGTISADMVRFLDMDTIQTLSFLGWASSIADDECWDT